LLDNAIEQSESLLRLAYVAVYSASTMAGVEKSSTKPFNPLLGETYELVTPRYTYFAE